MQVLEGSVHRKGSVVMAGLLLRMNLAVVLLMKPDLVLHGDGTRVDRGQTASFTART